MKKILEKGNKTLPEEKLYVKKCNICGCKFIYNKSEIYHDFIHGLDYVKCPQCYYKNYESFIRKRYRKGEK